jgi:trk system potassium uptake protein TrkH
LSIPSKLIKAINPLRWKLSIYQKLSAAFAGIIVVGALLLMTPYASAKGNSLSFVDALFTATSAVCVTGLVVVDTGTYFSVFGQIVLILLIQVGGLGIMTVATFVAVISSKKITLKERLVIQEATNQLNISGVVRLTLHIIGATLLIEFIGGTFLAIRWFQDYGLQGVYFGYWHAVSAFCNAGFDLFGEYRSITQYVNDFTVNSAIGFLIVIGGIGFPVIADLWDYRNTKRCTLHTKIVLSTTAVLILFGALVVFWGESSNDKTLGALPFGGKLLASVFQSISSRTAGYNSIDIGSLREGTLLAIIMLMFIGASPSSMGGGVKTSTIATLMISLAGAVTGGKEPQVFYRQIPQYTVYKAFIIVIVSFLLVFTVTLIMSFTEEIPLFKILFEVTSAFGTVGLSTGITPTLSAAGKILITFTMFAGRVGTLTLLMALVFRPQKNPLQYPKGKIIIG